MSAPSFFAILPASVRYDNRLKAAEKILYCEITCLTEARGYCYASNGYFAKLYEVDERTVRRWLNRLQKLGYLEIEQGARDGSSTERRIRPLTAAPPDATVAPIPPDKIVLPPDRNVHPSPDKNVHQNNTRENNINIPRGPARAGAREESQEKPAQDPTPLPVETVDTVFEKFAGDDTALLASLRDFAQFRAEKKNPLSVLAARRACAKLKSLAKDAGVKNKSAYMVAVIDQSIFRTWDGLFPVRDYEEPSAHASPGGVDKPRVIAADVNAADLF